MTKVPQIAILGRPNVGKSTLFNRIAGRRRALVGNEPGMTRDRLYATAEWRGKQFEVVDTGGIIPAERESMAEEIFRQAKVAIDEAAHLILIVDAQAGVVPLDEELAQLLRRTGKPLALAVNKIDAAQHSPLAAEFYRLGVRNMFPVSAEHGLGVDDLLDGVTTGLPDVRPLSSPDEGEVPLTLRKDRSRQKHPVHGQDKATGRQNDGEGATTEAIGKVTTTTVGVEPRASAEEPPKPGSTRENAISVAIIGRPNVGKSTLLNRLLKEDRSIVTPVPGTTRDAVDAELEHQGIYFRLIDTAGIRSKGKTKLLAEKLSVIQARKHLERSDVALLLLDATQGVTALDTHIGGYAHESHRSVIVVVNKWDAVKKGPTTTQEFTQAIRRRMKYLDYAPIVFISAEKGQRLGKLLGAIVDVATARQRRVPTAEMNHFLREVDLERAPVPAHRPLRIYYLTQVAVAPPTFVAFVNRSGKLHFSVERFLVNRIRERFGYAGTPIVIKSRQSR